MPDYQKAKIYKIWDNAYTKCYIGSTCEDLSKRMTKHRNCYKRYLNGTYNYTTSFALFEEFGVENCKVELLELYPCNIKSEIEAREGYYIRNNDCIDKIMLNRTPKEYNNDNEEYIALQTKIYREKNREQINNKAKKHYQENKQTVLERCKKYRDDNKTEICNYQKLHYQENKERINERRNEFISCDCGSRIRRGGKSDHMKTKKHQNYINQINQQEPSEQS